MAGLQGFGAGLLQGYGAVSRIQDQKRARDLQERRMDNQEEYRQQRLGLQQQRMAAAADEREYSHERDAIADERWGKEFGLRTKQAKADDKRADARLGIAYNSYFNFFKKLPL